MVIGMIRAPILIEEINKYKVNELIFINELYESKFKNVLSEFAFYKEVERLCTKNLLIKVAKSIYSRPNVTRYGILGPSETDIISKFVDKNRGVVIGYRLYNRLNLTTQVSNNIIVLSNNIKDNTKRINNVFIYKVELKINKKIKSMIEVLNVLENFYSIEDLNLLNFKSFINNEIGEFYEKLFDMIIKERNIVIKKSTIAFYHELLNFFNIENTLDKYLSRLSIYKIPLINELFK